MNTYHESLVLISFLIFIVFVLIFLVSFQIWLSLLSWISLFTLVIISGIYLEVFEIVLLLLCNRLQSLYYSLNMRVVLRNPRSCSTQSVMLCSFVNQDLINFRCPSTNNRVYPFSYSSINLYFNYSISTHNITLYFFWRRWSIYK